MEITLKSDLDPVAILALIVSLAALTTSIITYLSDKARVRIFATGDLITIPDDGYGKNISISISNVGKRATTIEGTTFSNSKIPNVARQFLPTNPRPKDFPVKLEPGSKEILYFYQDRLVESAGENIFAHIRFSHLRTPYTIKVSRAKVV
jgi:hypothetical protein